MKNDWLIASHFERMRVVISSINVLSVYAKLKLKGIDSTFSEEDIKNARLELITFVKAFRNLVDSSRKEADNIIVGSDPRMGDLVRHYLNKKQHLNSMTNINGLAVEKFEEMIQAENEADLSKVILYLNELRSLLEQHAYADLLGILGET